MAMKAMEMEGMNKSRNKDIYFHETAINELCCKP
jgi:hypothetical protein